MRIIFITGFGFLFIISYYLVDKRLFNYGQSDFLCYDKFPVTLYPRKKNDYNSQFGLYDKRGISIALNGVKYVFNSDTVEIDSIRNYYYDDSVVIVEIVSNQFSANYLEIARKYVSSKDYLDIRLVPVLRDSSSLKKVEICNPAFNVGGLVRIKNILRLLAILFMVWTLVLILKKSKKYF